MIHTLYIFQGVPGAGKTFVATYLKAGFGLNPLIDVAYHSTDTYHIDDDGVYRFKPDKIAEFHKLNQEAVRKSLTEGRTVILDNTNIHTWEAKPYVEMAAELCLPVVFIRVTSDAFASTHDVPEDKLIRMRNEIEDLSCETCLASVPPWEKKETQ